MRGSERRLDAVANMGVYITDAEIAALPDVSLLKYYNGQLKQIAAATSPYPGGTTGYDTFFGEVQAWLPSRTLPYFKKTPGDCPPFQSTGASPLQFGPQGGVAALSIASAGVNVIPVVGQAIGAVLGLFSSIVQHHAIAVANEQQTLCNVSSAFNSVIGQIDTAVYNGTATVEEGVSALRSIVTQLKASIDQTIKNEIGNSGSNYKGILDAHVLFAQILYKDLSPRYIATPAVPTVQAPASSSIALANFTSSLGAANGSVPVSASLSGPSWGTVGLIAAVGVVILLLVVRR